MHVCVYVCLYVYMYTYIYIYIHRETNTDRSNSMVIGFSPLHILYGHDAAVNAVACSVALDLVASASDDGSIILHSLFKGTYNCRSLSLFLAITYNCMSLPLSLSHTHSISLFLCSIFVEYNSNIPRIRRYITPKPFSMCLSTF